MDMFLKAKRRLAEQAEEKYKIKICFFAPSNAKDGEKVDNRLWIELTTDAAIMGVKELLAEFGYEIDSTTGPIRGGFYTSDVSYEYGLWVSIKPLKQITREMVWDGLLGPLHVIKLIQNPAGSYGTVAQIGDQFLGFGGRKASSLTPPDYVDQSTPNEMVDAILSALDGIKKSNANEYDYCYLCLV